MNSIRQRLLFWQISALVLTCVVVSGFTYFLAWEAFNRVRDFGMEQIAHSVVRHGVRPHSWALDRPEHASPRPTARPAPEDNPPPWVTDDLGRFISQIWSEDGELLYASIEGIGPPLQPIGFHNVQWAGEAWRVYTLEDDEEMVQVAKTASDRASSFAQMAPWLLVPVGLLVLVLSVLIRTAVNRALAPLDALRQDIRQRDEKDLHPVDTGNLPEEVAPLGQALNQLLERVTRLLARQRQMLADAAHELNTPLAAVKLQAQLTRRAPESMAAVMSSRKRMRRMAPLPPCHWPAPPLPARMACSSSRTGNRHSSTSGSVSRELVMCTCTASQPWKPAPAPLPPEMVS